jgi:thymidylate synthase
MGIPEYGFEVHWGQRSTDTFLGFPFNIASYATLAKILEEITLFVALGVGNQNAFISMTTNLKQ